MPQEYKKEKVKGIMDKNKKKELLETVAHGLDITPEMYNKAEKAVGEITAYLTSIESSLKIYKQGSFNLGTIVRPYKRDRKGDYDVDLVVEFNYDKKTVNSSIIKGRLGEYLKSLSYREYLDDEGRRCWTLIYPTTNGNYVTSTFHIDLLPCVPESDDIKSEIKPEVYQNTAIAITHISDKRTRPYTYKWRTSNPNGFAKWFNDLDYSKYSPLKRLDRQRVFNANKYLFESVESVGDDYTRSPLQMVIQILKRHRDVMYANTEREAYKPISIIITTLVGKIVEENNLVTNNTYELLNDILKGLEYYASLQNQGITSDYADEYKTKQLIHKSIVNGKVKWKIKNPANSGENLADKWCEDSTYATEFFRWVKKARNDLVDILDGAKPAEIIAKLKDCLGEDIGYLLEKFDFAETVAPRPVMINSGISKPYRL
jgi:hypothetical protein